MKTTIATYRQFALKWWTKVLFILIASQSSAITAEGQDFTSTDANGNVTLHEDNNGSFNPNRRDTTTHNKKEVPIGIRVWTIDRRFGDMKAAEPDTLSHLYMNSIFNTGLYGEYNTTGNNYTARQNRIFIDRPETSEFFFTQPYDYTTIEPDQLHFTNTLSPFSNVSYDECGDKTNGEDHVRAKFAVNANKRLGLGFDLNYAYARGYFQNQNVSHFGSTLFASYLGDRYQMHTAFSAYHRKVAENGGIIDDNYITHPESFNDTYAYDEIPTVLSQNWTRNNSQHFFLTHRYNFGFYRKVKMTDEEIKARQFAQQSKKDNAKNEKGINNGEQLTDKGNRNDIKKAPMGRPENSIIAGDEPGAKPKGRPDIALADSTRTQVQSKQQLDSLLAVQAKADSIEATMKKEYVPVTSIIHTLDINHYSRIYQAYATPTNYYANTYYDLDNRNLFSGDSIYDQNRYTAIKNTVALALLEGFNKYAKSGLKAFISYENVSYNMPDTISGSTAYKLAHWTGHNLSIGGEISKQQGRTWHYRLGAEAWLTGMNSGSLSVDFDTDLNFRLFGDTVRLSANAYFHRITPTFFQEKYHSKHLWWDNGALDAETRTHIEGNFSYAKTKTRLRVAIDAIQNYTYFGVYYDTSENRRTNFNAGVYQEGSNIQLLTAQLYQPLRWGILNWENVITYQSCNKKEVLPVPTFNIFTNLYLKFRIVKRLNIELGADATYFTRYYAPDYIPQITQYAVQKNNDARVELGGYPFIDVYANMNLKRARFFIMMSHINAGSGNRMQFLVPHYSTNDNILRFGVSWNFIN